MATKTISRERARTGNWIKWDGDESGETEFQVETLNNSLQAHIGGNAPSRRDGDNLITDGGYIAITMFRAGLKGLRGVIDSDTGEPVELKFEKVRIGTRKGIELCQKELYDQLPPGLLKDITNAITDGSKLGEDEKEDLDFTPDLSTQTSNAESAPETSQGVDTEP